MRAVGICDHEVCSICFLRLRAILRDFSCPVCKQNLEQVVCFDKDDLRHNFSEFQIFGEDAGPSLSYHHLSRMFFPTQYLHSRVESLWKVACSVCSTTSKDLKSLSHHVKSAHNLRICLLCVENLKVFPSEHKLYNLADYDKHLRRGDGGGSIGHPNCEFCRQRYYDQHALFLHLQKDHFTCHLCERDGVKFRYYKDYDNLQLHYEEEHFPCMETSCINKKFVVFSNEIDRRAHILQCHPHVQVSSLLLRSMLFLSHEVHLVCCRSIDRSLSYSRADDQIMIAWSLTTPRQMRLSAEPAPHSPHASKAG